MTLMIKRCTGRLQAMDRVLRADQIAAHMHSECADCARRFVAIRRPDYFTPGAKWIQPPVLTQGQRCPERIAA